MNIDEFIRESIRQNKEEAKQIMMKKKQERISELLAKSGLGKRFRRRTFENFEIKDKNQGAYNKAIEFAGEFPKTRKGLLITGPVGTGKTHLAAAIANYLIQQLYTVLFGNITDIVTLVKSTYSKDSEVTELQIIDALTKDVDLLVIDDLGKEYSTPNTRTLLYQVINRLYEDEKPIVITTNYNAENLKAKYGEQGEAIVSRITEMTVPIILAGDDWRLKL
ncbi:MAG TPA: ATP-binding protein [Thermoanaerobacterales bacterium]|nr:ATP-binding protein [Thermoanaerobacterales bacterium]